MATTPERAPMIERDPLDGTETVLVVEDERPVRELIRDVLWLHGYTVLEAGDGAEAIAVADAHSGPIHLLIVDVVMTGTAAADVVEHVRAARPDIRVLRVSGHPDDLLREHGVLGTDPHFLQKPFTVDALARKVREVLDGPPGG